MANQLNFISWWRSKLFDLTVKENARLNGKLTLTLSDTDTGQTAVGDAPFTFMAASDIAGLSPGGIKHIAPSPFTRDAETTKLVHVDFHEKDLPWRYTPEPAKDKPNPLVPDNTILRPWLVLLVGTSEEIQVAGDIANVDDRVLLAHNLQHSYLWAHAQNIDRTEISRLLSPRGMELDSQTNQPTGLLPQHEYVAVLVPAFNDNGEDMWITTGTTVQRSFGSKGYLTAFYTWRFWTSEAGDFETLATALHLPDAGDLGKARLHYRRAVPEDNIHIDAILEIRGAITSIQLQASNAEIEQVKGDLDALNGAIENAIGLPLYGRPWIPDPDMISEGWPAELNEDPRFRGIAGLGLWMGVEAQEALMDAAVLQAGALREAGQRIGNLAMGLWASGSLWDRRVPTDKFERLRIMGPIMRRMLAADGDFVLNRITSERSPLVPALFSSAAQRLLRDRSPSTRHITGSNGGLNWREALDEANHPEPPPERSPEGLPHVDSVAREMGLPGVEEFMQLDDDRIIQFMEQLFQLVEEICVAYHQKRDSLRQTGHGFQINELRRDFAENILSPEVANQLQEHLSERGLPCEGWGILQTISEDILGGVYTMFERVLEEESARWRLHHFIWQELRRCMGLGSCKERLNTHMNFVQINRETFCDELLDSFPSVSLSRKKPINLDQLSDVVFNALDPRKTNAPAINRVCSQIIGIDCTRLTRPEFPIGLDFPTWDLLKKYDKEWLLPGASNLEKDSITALQTNPEFIDAYMVGINTQFMSEMHWRDLAVDRNSTPLRMFWGQVNYDTKKRHADIEPLAEWAKFPEEPVGALSHQCIQPDDELNATGSRLVIAFHSDLFRRYPSTLVYLVKPPSDLAEAEIDKLLKATPELDNPATNDEHWRKNRKYYGPIFTGCISPELTFFAFDVKPTDLEQYWLVLDEPPVELRLRNDQKPDTANSATFAKSILDKPTRVAISGSELKQRGNNL